MAIVTMETQLLDSLDATTAAWDADGVILKLFMSDDTPALGDDTASYTEATFSGYAPLVIGPWDAAAMASGKARTEPAANPFVFENSTGAVNNDIYGYYVVSGDETTLLFAERGSAPPYDLNGAGKTLSITLRYSRGDDPAPD